MGRGITEVNKIALVKRTRRTETSQYPEEKTSTETPVSSGERTRTRPVPASSTNRMLLERAAIAGDSPVCESEEQGLE